MNNKSPTLSVSHVVNEQDNAVIENKVDTAESTVIPRYYGRRKGDESSSELSGSESEDGQRDVQSHETNP